MSRKAQLILNIVHGFTNRAYDLTEEEDAYILRVATRYEELKYKERKNFREAKAIALGEVIDEILALPEDEEHGG